MKKNLEFEMEFSVSVLTSIFFGDSEIIPQVVKLKGSTIKQLHICKHYFSEKT